MSSSSSSGIGSGSGSDSGSAGDLELINVKKVDIDGNRCALTDAIKIKFLFDAKEDFNEARWQFQYVVDSASKRHVIELGATEKTKYSKGSNSFEFSAPKIDISGLKSTLLLNVGLLTCTLINGDQHIADIKLVTQVSKKAEGTLMRNILNPLE